MGFPSPAQTDWKLHGESLPLSEEEWQAEFDRYKRFPEYQKSVIACGAGSGLFWLFLFPSALFIFACEQQQANTGAVIEVWLRNADVHFFA